MILENGIDREILLNRIIAGTLICPISIGGKLRHFLLKRPTAQTRYLASRVYEEVLENEGFDGLLDNYQAEDQLARLGLWISDNHKTIEKLKKDVEEIKVGVFKSFYSSKKNAAVRKMLRNTQLALNKLEEAKHLFDSLTLEGYATMKKTHYLIAHSLYHMNGDRVWGDDWEDDDSGLLERVLYYVNSQTVPVDKLRVLSRTDPWRSYWNVGKDSNIFGIPPIDYTDEQKTLCLLSSMYDGVWGHPECPSEAIVEDDDACDGWMIDQRKKGEQEKNKNTVENTLQNLKGQEIYIPASSPEDVDKINDMNSFQSKMVQKNRFQQIKEQGKVKELDLHDKKQELNRAIHDMQNKGRK